MSTPRAIGISLGGTNACVAVQQNEQVEIIPNDLGNRTTPCYVAFTGNERLVGETAKDQAPVNPRNTLFDIQRLLGCKFADADTQAAIKSFPFVTIDVAGKPAIQVQYNEEINLFSSEEICSMVITKLKESAEAYLGHDVKDAVIAVPAHFADAQRQATKDAGKLAGLNVLRIINEPTAAAIAYNLGTPAIADEHYVLIFDLGGSSFHATVLNIEEGIYEIMADEGDPHLGGRDFDDRLVGHFMKEFEREYQKDISGDVIARHRLRAACEVAKHALSSDTETTIYIDSLAGGINFSAVLTRDRFQTLCDDLFLSTFQHIEWALAQSRIDKSRIDDIVLVGGSTRIPRIGILLSDYFNGKEPLQSIDPEEVVARGAAIQAAILSGDTSEKHTFMCIFEVVPVSIGIEIAGGFFTPIAKRNNTIPTRKTRIFSTSTDNQTNIVINVYECERPRVQHGHLMGTLEIAGIVPAPRGVPQIEVTVDVQGYPEDVLTISAMDKATGTSAEIIVGGREQRDMKDVERVVNESHQFEAEDSSQILQNTLESYAGDVRRVTLVHAELMENDKEVLESAFQETISWLDSSVARSKEEYEAKQAEVESIVEPIVTKLYGEIGMPRSGGGLPMATTN